MLKTLFLISGLASGCGKELNPLYCMKDHADNALYCSDGSLNGDPDVPAGQYLIFVAINGLTNPIVLQDNGGDDLMRTTDGAARFATSLPDGSAYHVTVKTQPTAETCNVANGVGTIQSADITNITVTCAAFGIHCDTSVCMPSTQFCCDNGGTFSCVAAAGTCGGQKIACDDKSDCPITGQVCCAHVASGGAFQFTQCDLEATCAGAGNNVVLCNTAAPVCPSGGSCQTSQTPPLSALGYGECQ